jgi:hypothetical protein
MLVPFEQETRSMTRSTLQAELKTTIDSFIEELSATVRRAALASVQAALGDSTPARRGPDRPKMKFRVGGQAKAPIGKRSPEQVQAMAAKIASYVHSNPGKRLEQIASGLGTSTHELRFPVRKLLATKTLTKKGQKRGTTYFAGGRGAKK